VSASEVLYGRNPVHEALRAGRRRLSEVWATKAAAREPWLEGVRVRVAGAEEIAARAGSEAHQGVCAVAEPYPYSGTAEVLQRSDGIVVALDEIQDVQNLGAIARTAECVGAAGVVLCERRAAHVTPAAVKASAGATEHLRIARARNMADFLGEAKEAGFWTYGAAADGAAPYLRPDYTGGVVLVIGAEGRGLRPRVANACDELVALPMHGAIGSLNASAAAAALLYGILQRRNSA
jgi:23S rRNA (guanosine2251-2'-O)-methyltransferase